jgi:anti-anti-sigma factor
MLREPVGAGQQSALHFKERRGIMTFTITEHKSYKRCEYVKAKGRIDAHTASILKKKFDKILAAGKSGIVFDMEDVDFAATKGLWVLHDTHEACKRAKGKLVLLNIREQVRRPLIDLAGMKHFFEIYDDVTDAIGSF